MENKSIHCTLSDAELSAKADQWIDELIASGGKSFTMQVPAQPNKDTDLIFAELNNRFKSKLAERQQLKERCDKMEAALQWIKTYGPDQSAIGQAFIDKALAGKEVELSCMVCEKTFMGPEPKMCCSGRDCGCMGMPIEPIVCSKECYDNLPSRRKEVENG